MTGRVAGSRGFFSLALRRSRGIAAGVMACGALLFQGCALDTPLDKTLDSPGSRTPSVRTALPGAKIDPAEVYRRGAPAVVTVISEFGGGVDGLIGFGSGFAVGDRETIVTNTHVVTDEFDNHREATAVTIQNETGERRAAEIVGVDPHVDIAVLRTVGPVAGGVLRFARGESRIGDPVVAIGSPLGETYTMSVGYVSGVDRDLQGLAGFPIYGGIQTDAVITLGNSGGPLLNADGKVIGVNGQVLSVGGGGEGLGFAIPADLVRRSARYLAAGRDVPYAYLGVRGKPLWQGLFDELKRSSDVPAGPGVLVGAVRDGSPAALAGLRAGDQTVSAHGSELTVGGDVIKAIDGHRLAYNEQLGEALMRFKPGQVVTVKYLRNGERRKTRVRLSDRPLLWPSLWETLFG